MKSEEVYLSHILECIRRIEEDVAGGRDRFLAPHMAQDAVLRNLQILGESTQRLSEQLKTTQPTIEWQRIGAFRNLLVHNYLGIDLNVSWTIVERDVPRLMTAVQAMRQQIAGQTEDQT